MRTRGYTFIEILVVITIIALLASIASVSYFAVGKTSRDARRTADIESIRASLEMYRSELNVYPNLAVDGSSCLTATEITDTSVVPNVVYLKSIPRDPKTPTYCYIYERLTDTTYRLSYFSENDGLTHTLENP